MDENDVVVPDEIKALIEAGNKKIEVAEFEERRARGLALAAWENEWDELRDELMKLLPREVRPYVMGMRPQNPGFGKWDWFENYRVNRSKEERLIIEAPGCIGFAADFGVSESGSGYYFDSYFVDGGYVGDLDVALATARRLYLAQRR